MKKFLALMLALVLAMSLAACGMTANGSQEKISNISQAEMLNSGSEPATDTSISAGEATGAFALSTADGSFTGADNIYTITSSGTYVLTGLLEGQILVSAGEDDEVILELTGCTITYGQDSPIKILSAGKVEISAKSGTENVINDTRSVKSDTDSDQGDGAIYAVCDLKIKGSGTLVINAGYNNGIYTTKDLKIQKLSLKCTAYNNALKGNDSITIQSGTVAAISTNGDGMKTENTDVNKNGVTRGDITISGGTVTVYAAGDGIQAAHNFVLTTGEDGNAPTVEIYTGSYSGYTASDASTTSYKGVKVRNELNIESGSITIQSYDDGLHADCGDAFEDGSKGLGSIHISGGTVTMGVYAPANKTAGGMMGPGGWGSQKAVIGADGIHADGTLTISGGSVYIDSSYEGLEANVINISGGTTRISANDDGINACKGSEVPAINVTGGYLEVTVSANGDTDGIDSNGSYIQTGGVVITKGPDSENMSAIDADGSVTVSGGTLIILGYGRVSTGGNVRSVSLSLHSAGSHTVKIDGVSYSFTNPSAYGRTICYSDGQVTA
ncbi:MAG: carbohydrate-binding domain-containing protein [Firmicutes bacterium]|nr:carbohydrate-binding domain-containing protein [Bacillota bacterium]